MKSIAPYLSLGFFGIRSITAQTLPFQVGNTGFYTETVKRTWEDCNVAAASYNLDFASIRTQEEQDSIDVQTWVGGKRDCNACPFYWVDGSDFNFTNWDVNEPLPDSHLIKIKHNGKWRTRTNFHPVSGDIRKHLCLYRGEKPFDVGSAEISGEGDSLTVSHAIGPYITMNATVELLDFGCENKSVAHENNTVSLENEDMSSRPVTYDIVTDIQKVTEDPQGFVEFTNGGTYSGVIKFCTRVSTYEGSVEVAYKHTKFELGFDVLETSFNLTSISIQEKPRESFETLVDADYEISTCQCELFSCIAPVAVEQGDPLKVCITPTHPDGKTDVSITNFNVKMSAESSTDYYEYNPVWFGTGQYESDALTTISEQGKVIMIEMEVVAQFFIRGFPSVTLEGNAFLEFVSSKARTTPLFGGFYMGFDLVNDEYRGCFKMLVTKVLGLF